MASDASLILRRAEIAEILSLRHVILRAGLPFDSAKFDGDELPTTRHYGAFQEQGHCVACLTMLQSDWEGRPALQLRGMAVAASLQRTGLGSRLLALAVKQATDKGVRLFWCNARLSAVTFYEKHGWIAASEVFDIPTAGPHFKMTRAIA